ncbi:hypothetical protein DAEQUDRAFT_374687 [Daedalea quercina L-15889]|uniref:Uncharacterized protein n=1 Tax=Daedalea quercina L-15889 TaxID=1314783 RepID=A0A165P787_9APHY|nr:hypothetical protein DAEQUDRAFT_374687 [Daedalea quercina L-15889]
MTRLSCWVASLGGRRDRRRWDLDQCMRRAPYSTDQSCSPTGAGDWWWPLIVALLIGVLTSVSSIASPWTVLLVQAHSPPPCGSRCSTLWTFLRLSCSHGRAASEAQWPRDVARSEGAQRHWRSSDQDRLGERLGPQSHRPTGSYENQVGSLNVVGIAKVFGRREAFPQSLRELG